MIIDTPTALYSSVLPTFDGVGNVTFTISSYDPPRPVISPTPLTRGQSVRSLPPKIYDPLTRRTAFGELVFSVSSGSQTIIPASTKAFEVGQILDFDDVPEDIPTVAVLNVPDTIDLQQNTNVLDYEAAGLTPDEVQSIQDTAQLQMTAKVDDINALKTQIMDYQTQIQDNQRSLNEIQKLIDATTVLFGTDTSIPDKLLAKQQELQVTRLALISSANQLIALAQVEYNQLLEIKEVVR